LIFSTIPFIHELHSPSPIFWTWSCITSYKLAAPLSHHPRTGPRKRAPGRYILQRLHLDIRRIFSGEQHRKAHVFAKATIEFPSRRRSPWSAWSPWTTGARSSSINPPRPTTGGNDS
jgi:hypothetical protein